MNRSLIVALSLFGLAMGFATVFVVSAQIEPAFWLAIFVFSAFAIAKRARDRVFFHGVFVGLLNSVWITSTHVAFASRYLAHHPQEAAMSTHGLSARAMMAIVGPTIGLMSGVVIGALALLAKKLLSRRTGHAARTAG
jgi:hypothetical protein